MKALVYHGPAEKSWESKPDPSIERATDAIVRIDTTIICGTDLHILKGDVPTLLKLVSEGRLDTTPFATHRFGLDEIEHAYDVFTDAANTNALKVVLSAS